jgi:outer membrane protein TolC
MSRVSPSTKCSLSVLALLVVLGSGPPAQAETLVTLKQAYAHAMRNHPSILMLKERVLQAEVARYKAWSPLKPTASLQATYTYNDQSVPFNFPIWEAGMNLVPDSNSPGGFKAEFNAILDSYIQKQHQFGFNVVAKLPLFMGPAYQGIGIARKQVELARLSTVRSEKDFMLNVAQAYYLVVTQKEVVKALEKKVEVNNKHLEAAKARFQVGQSARSMVLRADLVATQDNQKLRQQVNTLKAARRQLAILLGLTGSVEVQRPAEPVSIAATGKRQVDDALQQRHDYQATELAVSIARQSRKAAWWGFAPTLDLTWLYRWTNAEGFAGDKDQWNLMFTLNLPLYDGGIRYANLRDAKSKIREATLQQGALGLQIEGQIVKLRADVESANAGVISARKAVELARTTASDMEASFQAGAMTQLDVIDANQRLLDAELAVTSSLFQRDLARLSLAHALGRYDPLKKRN